MSAGKTCEHVTECACMCTRPPSMSGARSQGLVARQATPIPMPGTTGRVPPTTLLLRRTVTSLPA